MLFDLPFILASAIICIVVVAVEAPSWFQVGYLFPVFVLYGLSATILNYIISVLARSQLSAFAFAAGIQATMFLLSILTFTVSSMPFIF
jgi:hypothetical protein